MNTESIKKQIIIFHISAYRLKFDVGSDSTFKESKQPHSSLIKKRKRNTNIGYHLDDV